MAKWTMKVFNEMCPILVVDMALDRIREIRTREKRGVRPLPRRDRGSPHARDDRTQHCPVLPRNRISHQRPEPFSRGMVAVRTTLGQAGRGPEEHNNVAGPSDLMKRGRYLGHFVEQPSTLGRLPL